MANPTVQTGYPINRRQFIQTAAVAGGGLALITTLPALAAEGEPRQGPPGNKPIRDPSAFIRIAADDTITIITPSVEMGQGAHTAIPMIVMEELGGDWARLAVADAATAAVYNNPIMGQQMTVGSTAVRGWYNDLRRVGAAAREMLVSVAASDWKVPASECTVANSVVKHGPSGRSVTFGKLAARAAKRPVPQQPTLMARADFKLIGTSPHRVDVPHKVDGSARFGIDTALPDMLFAAVKTSPTFGGKLKSYDVKAATAIRGYHSTVPLENGVITLASSYWQARKALDAVTVEYDRGALATLNSAGVSKALRAAFAADAPVARSDGDAAGALNASYKVMESVYEAPYLAHACMEPMNCTARVTAAGCEVWCSTQAPQAAQQTAAKVLMIAPERVKVNSTYLGGGFGRRGETDYVAQAVAAAATTGGRPVKVIWTREEDIQHDFYRPAAAIRFRAGFDAAGKLTAIESNIVTASAPTFGPPGRPTFADGVADATYQVPNFRVTALNRNLGVPFGYWRSVNHSHNPFMFEGFIDEIAGYRRQDPYEFRRSLLQHEAGKRQLRVLDLVAEKAQWKQPKPGRNLGISAFTAFGSIIGTVVEVSVKDKVVTLHRVVSAIDCGVAIHPDNIQAQLEGGMVYGLSAVLRGEITIDKGAVQQSNFSDYPLLTMAEMPPFECHVVPSDAVPGGIGEPGTAPIAPALANAISAATGTRVRTLPLSKLGFRFATSRT